MIDALVAKSLKWTQPNIEVSHFMDPPCGTVCHLLYVTAAEVRHLFGQCPWRTPSGCGGFLWFCWPTYFSDREKAHTSRCPYLHVSSVEIISRWHPSVVSRREAGVTAAGPLHRSSLLHHSAILHMYYKQLNLRAFTSCLKCTFITGHSRHRLPVYSAPDCLRGQLACFFDIFQARWFFVLLFLSFLSGFTANSRL